MRLENSRLLFVAAIFLAPAVHGSDPLTADGWIFGLDTHAPQVGTTRPALNVPFHDDVYGQEIRRVSERNSISDLWIRHEYSRRQAFNSDSTRLIMVGNNGAWMAYDLDESGNVTFDRKLPSMSEPNWNPRNPDRFWYFPRNGGNTIFEYDFASDSSREVANFAGRLPWPGADHVWTVEEGEPSADGRIWCLVAEYSDFTAAGMFAYDLTTDTILGSARLSGDPNHISTSPSGEFCVPSGAEIGGTWAYSTDFSQNRLLHGKSEHSDVAIDRSGQDVLVFADYDNGWVMMADMASGEKTRLTRIYEQEGSAYALHLSGNSYQRPGYVVLSTYAATTGFGHLDADYGDIWGHDRLAIIELAADPEIYNVAYMHNRYSTYWTEPHATVNLDLDRILFVSNWETGDESQIHSYLVTLDRDESLPDTPVSAEPANPPSSATTNHSGLWRDSAGSTSYSIKQSRLSPGQSDHIELFWRVKGDGETHWIRGVGSLRGNQATLDGYSAAAGTAAFVDGGAFSWGNWQTITLTFDDEQSARISWTDANSGNTRTVHLSRIRAMKELAISDN